jgi:hypothetical protein
MISVVVSLVDIVPGTVLGYLALRASREQLFVARVEFCIAREERRWDRLSRSPVGGHIVGRVEYLEEIVSGHSPWREIKHKSSDPRRLAAVRAEVERVLATTCVECERTWVDHGERWQTYLTADDQPVLYCPSCAYREFGVRG